MLKSKIHRARVTEADLNYVGSITIDEDLIEKADLIEYEKVLVVDIDNGSRFETYVMKGPRGSGKICLNGAAARLVQINDRIIVMSFSSYSSEELKNHKPIILFVDDNNRCTEIL
jgi:aspartate 1-decarboxylase